MPSRINTRFLPIILITLALILGIQLIANFLVDILWFQEVGYLNIFLTRITTQLGWGLFVFFLSILFLYGNLKLAEKFKWKSNSTPQIYQPESQGLTTSILLFCVFSLGLIVAFMLIYYGQLAYASWQIDYILPKITEILPSPLALWSFPQIIPQISKQVWLLIIVVITLIYITKNNETFFRIIALIFSILFGLAVAGNWTVILLMRAATPFNQVDPQFHKDLSFYLFKLPGFKLLDFCLGGIFLYTLIAVTLTYLLADNSLSRGKFIGFARVQLRHIYGLAGAMFVVLAWRHWLRRYDLLYSERGVTYGASYTDVNVQIPLEIVLTLVAIFISIWLFWKAITGAGRYNTSLTQLSGRQSRIGHRLYKIPFSLTPFYIYIILLLTSIVLGAFVQYIIVQPNELAREKPYILRNIDFTRQGFNINNIEPNVFDPTGILNQEKIDNNPLTIKNIRLWDTRPLLQTNRQLQQIRPYYRFYDADIDRYTITDVTSQEVLNTTKQQVIIAARELDYNEVPPQAQTWVNQHLVFTHGFGFTLSPVNLVDEGGLPYYFVKDIGTGEGDQALTTSSELIKYSIPIGKPRIYYGELTDNYIMTSTKVKEFDFPSGQDNVYNVYDGTGGINIGSYWRRLIFAIHLRDWQMLFTENFTPDTKLLFRRNINRRLRTIAPFLRYDQNPYLVVTDAGDSHQGKSDNYLHWIMDAYTTSSYYPYSDPGDNKFNYIRNSVKIVVDAYHGDVQFYVADSRDPIIQTWSKIFPQAFQSLDNMPTGLHKHIRYPQDLFATQSERLLTYHMLDPQVFYNREDLWRIPNEIYGSEILPVEPYYLIIKLPTAQQEEFILVHVYTPNSRNNLIAMLFGLSDGEDYGKCVLYVLPKERLVYGTEQIESRINQDPIISQQFSLWNREASKVIQGNLLVIPIEKSLLYVEPIYLEATQNSIPTLVRVVVVYQNQIVMAESLNKGLDVLFGGQQENREEPPIIRPIEEIEPS